MRGARRSITLASLALLLSVIAGCAIVPVKGQQVAESQIPSGSPDVARPDANRQYPPCHEPVASPTPSPDLARVESIAMPESQFWALIDGLHRSLRQAAFDRVSRALSRGSLRNIIAFDARLTLDLYQLDSACRVEWYGHHDPDHLGFPLDDDFLYFRCSTIIAGERNFEIALRTQTLPWGSVSTEDFGEPLLYVGITAAEIKGISDDRFFQLEQSAIPISYETAHNPQGWPAEDVDQDRNIPH